MTQGTLQAAVLVMVAPLLKLTGDRSLIKSWLCCWVVPCGGSKHLLSSHRVWVAVLIQVNHQEPGLVLVAPLLKLSGCKSLIKTWFCCLLVPCAGCKHLLTRHRVAIK